MTAFTGNSLVGQVVAGDGHVVSGGQHGVVNGVLSPAAFGAVSTVITAVPQTVQVLGITRDQVYIGLEGSGHVLLEDGTGGLLLEASPVLFGTPTVKQVFNVAVAGLGSAQSFGAVTISARITKLVGGVASAQQFGSAVAKPPPTTVPVGGVQSAKSFGVVTVVWSQIVQAPGLPQQSGVRSIVGGVISGDGHLVGGTDPLFGRPKLIPGVVTVSFATLGLGSAQRFGVPVMLNRQFTGIAPGVSSAQRFGVPWIIFWQPLPLLGVPSAQAFGLPNVYLVWLYDTPCTGFDLAAITCTDLDLVTVTCATLTLATASPTTLDLTASEAEDLDLQPAGCD
jgi:hypothetical protein